MDMYIRGPRMKYTTYICKLGQIGMFEELRIQPIV
jgi:hypothetical protein